MNTVTETVTETPAVSNDAAPTIKYSQEFRFRAPKETREEIAKKCFPGYVGKPGEIFAWIRSKDNTDRAAIRVYLEESKKAEEVINADLEIPNLHTWTPEEMLALVFNKANSLFKGFINTAKRKNEEIKNEYSFDKLELLEEAEDEESVSAARLDEDEQKLYQNLCEEFMAFKKYRDAQPLTFRLCEIALTGKQKEILHRIKQMNQYFLRFLEAFAGWIDTTSPDSRPLVEKGMKRQAYLLEKARVEYAKIVADPAEQDMVAV